MVHVIPEQDMVLLQGIPPRRSPRHMNAIMVAYADRGGLRQWLEDARQRVLAMNRAVRAVEREARARGVAVVHDKSLPKCYEYYEHDENNPNLYVLNEEDF